MLNLLISQPPNLPITLISINVNRFSQPLDIANRKQATDRRVCRVVVAVAFHGWHMVGTEDAVEVDVAIGLHTFEHVGLAFVVEGLFEAFWRATHIAEVDKERDLLLLAESYGSPKAGHPSSGVKLPWQRQMPLTSLGTVSASR